MCPDTVAGAIPYDRRAPLFRINYSQRAVRTDGWRHKLAAAFIGDIPDTSQLSSRRIQQRAPLNVMGRAARSYIIRPSLLEGGHYNERRNNARPRPAHKGSAPHCGGPQHHIPNACHGLASPPPISRRSACARSPPPRGCGGAGKASPTKADQVSGPP